MSARLSAADIRQLEAALIALLSPLDFESVAAWRRETRLKVAALLRCEASVSLLPLDGETGFQHDIPISVHEYAQHYYAMDPARNVFRALGTKAFIWPTLRPRFERPSPDAWLRSEFYNDWVRRQRLCQPCALMVVRAPEELPHIPFETWRGIAGLWFYWPKETPSACGERELALLRLLLPAFEAGLHLLQRCGRERKLVAEALSGIGEGAVVVNETGRITYENAALGQLLLGEPDAQRIRAACSRMGRLLLAATHARKSGPDGIVDAPEERVRTRGAAYRLRRTLLGPGHFGPTPMALVVVTPTEAMAALVNRAGRHYHLTPRELAVSSLLAKGHSNADVARLLGVSIHTARRHVEHVLMKLGVHSRAAVAAKLLGSDTRISA